MVRCQNVKRSGFVTSPAAGVLLDNHPPGDRVKHQVSTKDAEDCRHPIRLFPASSASDLWLQAEPADHAVTVVPSE